MLNYKKASYFSASFFNRFEAVDTFVVFRRFNYVQQQGSNDNAAIWRGSKPTKKRFALWKSTKLYNRKLGYDAKGEDEDLLSVNQEKNCAPKIRGFFGAVREKLKIRKEVEEKY